MKYHINLSTFIQYIPLSIFTFFLLSQKSFCVDPYYEACAARQCGTHNISYPFYIQNLHQPYCGYPGFEVSCTTNGNPIIHIPQNDYIVEQIFYPNNSLRVYNAAVLGSNNGCFPDIRNVTLRNQFNFGNVSQLVLLSNCSAAAPGERISRYRVGCEGENGGGWGLAMFGGDENLRAGMDECGVNVVAPVDGGRDGGGDGVVGEYEELLRRGFMLNWTAGDCSVCETSGGRCGFNYSTYHFRCFCPDRPHVWRCRSKESDRTLIRASEKRNTTVILASVIPGGFFIICVVVFIIWRRNKWNYLPYFLSKNTSSDLSSARDVEGGSVYFGVSVFSYSELEEATNNFDPSKELGDGGFGTVYYGKLRDGREVAVKRLYENTYKRVEQFLNEIEILTRMRHRNLVLLYGCTSRRSSELLLVYEYIPNGTVADHLHGDRARPGSLPWPIRMNIAIETASALVYLHANDIIHRDVKTNNILLDNNFCVKVADFGLSRLFPIGVTHVSTAPQGTPGYVDPEYHQCYQLTDKSDVYSFGVVLIELISSMPAVDISRHRHEINLANLAINRIQNSAFSELIDPCLGYDSDAEVERMTTSVAELAFRCLQLEKELRPTMDEVLEVLKEIQDYDNVSGDLKNGRPPLPPSPESDVAVLLNDTSKAPSSPNSVTDKWVSSRSTTASSS